MSKFTIDNFKAGFLIDEELMAGITEPSDAPGTYTAYVVRHTTGESLGSQIFSNPFEAIRTLNGIAREWTFEAISKCGSGNCGKEGGCSKEGGGSCSKRAKPPVETISTPSE